MIKNFFRTLTDQRVQYLLISGQASVLYGAATFSEDIDLWINPTTANRARFLSALRACGARYYKLTPPFTLEYLKRGHGFHFLLPASNEAEVFLDVLGAPPRVGAFESAAAAARWIDSEWGRLHVIGLKDLVELKKTQRLEDYPVISKLALAWLDQPGCKREPDDFAWSVSNIFTVTELRVFFHEHSAALRLAGYDLPSPIREFARQLVATGDVAEEVVVRVSEFMQLQIARLQQADRNHWRDIVAELKSLRESGGLQAEGNAV
jgi:hypothetical protein